MSALEGKEALVTGVTSGIGEALAERLCRAGARVVGVGRDPARLGEVRERLGPAFEPLVCDLAQPHARQEVAASLATRKPFDIVVNNAAEVAYEAPSRFGLDAWRRLFEVNVFAGIELVRAVAPNLPRGARIVNTSSVVARSLPQPRFGPYAVSKAALESFTEALRQELAPRGVHVTLVAPGLVDTPIYGKVEGFERMHARLREDVRTWLTAEDVAEAIVWTLTRPAHVNVADLVLLPEGQAR